MAGNGVMSVGQARTTAGFMNNPAFNRDCLLQARLRSGVFGNLSGKQIRGENSGTERGVDISKSPAILRVEKSEGDTHTWTMQKPLKGKPTFGDQRPEKGGTLDFLHADVVLHKTRSPAFQVPPDMDRQRMASSVDVNHESALREETVRWHGDAIPHEVITTFLMGGTDNVRTLPAAGGGRGVDFGRGAGVQVSPRNAIVRGLGKVSGATLAAREADLKSKIGSLSSANAAHLISIAAIQELSEELSTGSSMVDPLDVGGEAAHYLVLPAACRLMLQGAGSTMVDYAKYTAAWGADSPLLKMRPLQIGNIIVFFDNILSKYQPDVTGSEIVWGKSTTDFQSWGYEDQAAAQLTRGVGLLFGKAGILEASNKGVKFTSAEEDHETGKEISSYVKRSMMRAMFKDKQDTSILPYEPGTLLFMFAYKGITHGV